MRSQLLLEDHPYTGEVGETPVVKEISSGNESKRFSEAHSETVFDTP